MIELTNDNYGHSGMKQILGFAFTLFILSACGGGAGNSQIFIDSNKIDVRAFNGKVRIIRKKITIADIPETGIFVAAVVANNRTIQNVDIQETSRNTADLVVTFPPGAALGEGVHTNSIELYFCLDQSCNRQLRGSPFVVPTKLSVELGSVSLQQNEIVVSASKYDSLAPDNSTISISVNDEDLNTLFVQSELPYIDSDSIYRSLVSSFAKKNIASSKVDVRINYETPRVLQVGENKDSVLVSVCYDRSCVYHVPGSPLTVSTVYKVTLDPPGGISPVPIAQRNKLDHDIIDAEYSNVLDSVVMVSSSPDNAVYVYNTKTNKTNKFLLNLPPVAVSVDNSDTGKRFAIGHDAHITVIDFNEGSPSSSSIKVLDASTEIYDLVVKGDNVYTSPVRDQWVNISKINIPNNTEVFSVNSVYARSRIKLHPSGKYVYLADQGVSPSDIEKMDIQGEKPVSLYDSPYHGDYEMGGNLWLSHDGKRIYTTLGNTFKASELQSQDMLYDGAISLSEGSGGFGSKRIVDLSESTSKNEITLIESDWSAFCTVDSLYHSCRSNLRIYTRDFLNDKSKYAFFIVNLFNKQYQEVPKHVFYSSDGKKLFVLTSLYGISTPVSYLVEVKQ
jgi:hypothetical protein